MKEITKEFNQATRDLAERYYNGLIGYDEWDKTYRKMERAYERKVAKFK